MTVQSGDLSPRPNTDEELVPELMMSRGTSSPNRRRTPKKGSHKDAILQQMQLDESASFNNDAEYSDTEQPPSNINTATV